MKCSASTKNDVRDLINDVTANEDDPQKIVHAIEKGLLKEIVLTKTIWVRIQL